MRQRGESRDQLQKIGEKNFGELLVIRQSFLLPKFSSVRYSFLSIAVEIYA